MANIKKLKSNGQDIVPITHEQAVLDSNGVTLDSKLNAINNAISRLENNSTSGAPSLEGNTLTFGNYTITYNETDDTLDFIYNGATDEPGTDEITWLTDYSLDEVGELKAKTGNAVTDFIIYDNSFEYLLSKDTVMNFRCYFYDNNKTFISRTDNNNDLSTVDSKITFPENTAYFRLKVGLNGLTESTLPLHVIIKKTELSYIKDGLSLFIDAEDVTSYGSIRDVTGKQTITNHGVSTTLDNGCLNFVSSESDYIDTNLVPNLTQWSTEAYFYYTSSPSTTQALYSWGNSKSNRVRLGYTSSGNIMKLVTNSSQGDMDAIDNYLTLCHIVFTANNGTFIVYINGIKQYEFTGKAYSSHTGTLKIGTGIDASADFADINLKIFRHYDGKVLSDEEVLQNYNYEINRCESIIAVTWNDGKSLTSDGSIVDNETAMITELIQIDENYNYTISYANVSEVRIISYDINKAIISRSEYLTSGSVDTLIEFPEGTTYFRIKVEKVGTTVNEANDNIIIKKVLK